MSTDKQPHPAFPLHGQLGYLQLPATNIERSATFYREVFNWTVENDGFQAPGLIGQWTTEREPATSAGALLWICADNLSPTLDRVVTHGGVVVGPPQLDGGERWLIEVDDPAGNRVGVVVPVGSPKSQTLIAVNDVEASSLWYQQLLDLRSDHGGPEYERLLSGGRLVLQLHHKDVEHHHGRIGGLQDGGTGSGVLLWFGDVPEFDEVVGRANRLGAVVVRAPHRNPPDGNGPAHRELWIKDPDGYTVVVASPDGEVFAPGG